MSFAGILGFRARAWLFFLLGLLGLGVATETGLQPKPVASQASRPAASNPAAVRLPFEVGEQFTYLVSWKVFDAGIATLTLAEKTVFQNEEVYKINATVRSTGIVSALFQVVDVFESLFHRRDLCSRQIAKNIQEGRRHRSTTGLVRSQNPAGPHGRQRHEPARSAANTDDFFHPRMCSGCDLGAISHSNQESAGRRPDSFSHK